MDEMPEENESLERETVSSEESSVTVTRRWETSARRRRALVIITALLILLLIFAAILIWRSRKSAETASEESSVVVSVRVARVERQTIASQVSALGTIFPREQAQVSAKISAQIKQMPILKNRVVHAGDVIAVLESGDLQAQRNEAAAALRGASKSAERHYWNYPAEQCSGSEGSARRSR